MSKRLNVAKLLTLFLLTSLYGIGQNNAEYINARSAEFQALHSQQFTQGRNYGFTYPGIKGHQFWGNGIYEIGEVTFEGISYPGVLLNYDNYNNLLVTALVQNGLTRNIYLDNSRIDGFQIHDQNFINFRDSLSGVEPGMYMVAYKNGQEALYIRTKKTILGNTGRPGELLKKFAEHVTHIIMVNGESHVVKNKREVLELFTDDPQTIAFIKSSRLKFKQPNEMTTNLVTILKELNKYK